MMRLSTTLMVACLLAGFYAFAAEPPLMKPQTQNGIEYVSGGVGMDEHKAMRAIQGNYNVHLVFAVKGTGEFVSEVKVKITGAGGKTVLDTVSPGPDLFAKLPPGHYNLVADRDGHVIKESILAPAKHGVSVVLYYPVEKGD